MRARSSRSIAARRVAGIQCSPWPAPPARPHTAPRPCPRRLPRDERCASSRRSSASAWRPSRLSSVTYSMSQIVALVRPDRGAPPGRASRSPGASTQLLVELVQFEEDARIGRIERKGSVVGWHGLARHRPACSCRPGPGCGARWESRDRAQRLASQQVDGLVVGSGGRTRSCPDSRVPGHRPGRACDGRSAAPARTRLRWGSSSRATPAPPRAKASPAR